MAIALKDWAAETGLREFPWRGSSDAYTVATTEVLLQQTRAQTVAPLFGLFHDRWPGWEALAEGPLKELELFLTPIGLQSRRAAALMAMAAAVQDRGMLPSVRDELEGIPGIGQYVASAVLALCHGRREPMIDTNLVRILTRFIGGRSGADYRHDVPLQQFAKEVLRWGHPRETNFALLDLGAIVCTPRQPKCAQCPLLVRCRRWGIT